MNKLPKQYAEALAQAKSQNLNQYQGRPCRKGHSGLRFTKNGECVECNYARQKTRYHERQGLERARAYYKQNVERKLWHGAYHRAKKKGLEFTLSIKQIVIPDVCPVLGTPMDSPSIDRFDSTKSYTPDNVRIISTRANMLKNNGTIEEFEKILDYLRSES